MKRINNEKQSKATREEASRLTRLVESREKGIGNFENIFYFKQTKSNVLRLSIDFC